MPLALGQELSKVNLLKEPYSKILGATKEGIDDIKILSSKHIITEDLYETNISYDSKFLFLIHYGIAFPILIVLLFSNIIWKAFLILYIENSFK